ncbi:MAG: polysaccharide biosynthesis tyrosine autokinase [Leptolyngbyaceae cyanobacterium RU_5_1]|nr:polysaccharide biosynthesis tyrosine autokinase [Leptolyngbyaceae cyanobacterium RU_5_1]
MLQSPELLSKIAAQIQSRYPDVTAASLALDLKTKDLAVTRVGQDMLDSTRALNVTYKGTDPQKVQFVLEKLAEGYLRFSLEDRKTRIGGGVEFIEDQLPALQQRVNSLEQQVQALRQRYRLTDPTIENTSAVEQLKDVQEKLLESETALREQSSLSSSLQRQLQLTPEQALAAVALSQNPRYQDLLTQLKKVESEIAVKLARFSEESPVVQRLRGQQANLNRLLGQETQRTLNETSPGVSGSTQILAFQDPVRVELIRLLVQSANQTKALQARTQEIVRSEAVLDQRLRQLPAIVRQYNSLQQQLTIATQTLNQFLLQRETLRVEAAQKEVPWEIISKPNLAIDPATGKAVASKGKKAMQMLIAGFAAGLLLGLAAALLREKLRDRFVTAEDLQDAVPLPFFGVIPTRKGMGGLSDSLGSKLMDPFSDAFSSLYTNLRFLNSGSPIRLLAVGSVESGDGKTTVALNLAQIAASMGQRVLLVDANLVSPQLHTLLDLSNQRGLTDILRYKVDVEQVVQRSPLEENLFVLTSGSVQMDSTRLFASTEMQRLVKQLRETFDFVIFDTPALFGLTDTNFLTAQTDGMLMVVGVNKTRRSLFTETLNNLKKFRLPVIGMVANRGGRGQAIHSQPTYLQSSANQSHPAFFGKKESTSDAVQ